MNAAELRTWLLAQPRPASLRIIAGDQVAHKLAITEGMQWKQAAESVMALQPELVEALDADGALLRAVRPDDFESEEEEPAEVIEVPAGSDPESQRLIIFAKLISHAYEHSTDVAFERLASLFESVVKRSEAQEKTISALDRMLQKMVVEKLTAEADGGGDGGPLTLESLFQGFMQGKMQAQVEKAAAVPTNGVAHKEKTK